MENDVDRLDLRLPVVNVIFAIPGPYIVDLKINFHTEDEVFVMDATDSFVMMCQ